MISKEDLALFEIPAIRITVGVELAMLSNHVNNLEKYENLLNESIEIDRGRHLSNLSANEERMGMYREIDFHYESMKEEVARVLNNPIVVSLWGTVEAITELCCEYVRNEKKLLFGFDDLTGRSLIVKTKKYLNEYSNLEVNFSEQAKLDDIKTIRNIIAHSNGNISACDKKKKEKIRKLLIRNQGIDISPDEVLYISNMAIKKMHTVVNTYLQSMINEVVKIK